MNRIRSAQARNTVGSYPSDDMHAMENNILLYLRYESLSVGDYVGETPWLVERIPLIEEAFVNLVRSGDIVANLQKRGFLKDIRHYGREEALKGYLAGDTTIYDM
jgi:hypothetical protein